MFDIKRICKLPLGWMLAGSLVVGCSQNVGALSDEQLKQQLEEAQRDWKTTGAQVDEKDADYITDPKIQASHTKLKALRAESEARALKRSAQPAPASP